MKNLFNLDTPLMQMLTRVGDMIIINFLTIICSLPIITAGAAISATHRIMQDFLMDNETTIISTYFRAFKENFKQATLVWLALVVIIAALLADVFLINLFIQGSLRSFFVILLSAVALIVFAISMYIFPLLTRYRNTLPQHLRNSLILMITKLPRTIGMMALHALPFVILWLSYNLFLQTLIFWLFVGASFTIFMDTFLLKPVFQQLEKTQQPS